MRRSPLANGLELQRLFLRTISLGPAGQAVLPGGPRGRARPDPAGRVLRGARGARGLGGIAVGRSSFWPRRTVARSAWYRRTSTAAIECRVGASGASQVFPRRKALRTARPRVHLRQTAKRASSLSRNAPIAGISRQTRRRKSSLSTFAPSPSPAPCVRPRHSDPSSQAGS